MEKSICRYNVSMKELLIAINNEPAGIAFIVDEEEKLCGVVTDGDFRRMLLGGKLLDSNISKSDLKPFVSAQQGEDTKTLLARTDRRVRLIPIVDSEGRPVDYFQYDHRVKMIPVAEPSLEGGNEFKYLCDAFLSTWISSTGQYITRFEKEFSAWCQAKHGVAVSNGTVALHLALEALRVGKGDEVIVPDLTFAATANAVLHAGATPVIVDVDLQSWCISPDAIRKAITPRTKAIIPVHVYGQPCDMDSIMQIAREHNLFVIEDAAEAHGAKYKGKPVGSFGHIACFSFYANKLLTTGEGGMCLTQSDELDERMRVLRDHGMNKQKRYWHEEVGYNYRMTNLQAAIGCGQLERIDQLLNERIQIEATYKKSLDHFGLIDWQANLPENNKVTWLVAVMAKNNREKIFSALRENMVDVRPFFYPMSQMPPYKNYTPVTCSNAIHISEKGFNLPTIKNLDFDKIAKVFATL